MFLHHQERILYSTSSYAFGDFSENPSLSHLSSDPEKYRSTYFMPTEADRMLTRFRDWIYRRTGGGVRWGKASLQSGLPHRLPPNELFSVYNEHTKSCSVCQRAVKRFQAIRAVFAVSAALALTIIRGKVVKVAVGAILTALSFLCHKFLRRYFVYEFAHQENN